MFTPPEDSMFKFFKKPAQPAPAQPDLLREAREAVELRELSAWLGATSLEQAEAKAEAAKAEALELLDRKAEALRLEAENKMQASSLEALQQEVNDLLMEVLFGPVPEEPSEEG